MKNLIFILNIILFLTLPVMAGLKSQSAGGVRTVMPDGFSDILRNPALLMSNPGKGSWGLAADYGYLINSDSQADFNIEGLDDEKTSTDTRNLLEAGLHSGIYKKGRRNAFGIIFSQSDDSQYNKIESELNYSANNNSIQMDIETDEKTINPAIGLAWSYRIARRHNIGLSLKMGYSFKNSKSRMRVFSGSVQESEQNDTLDTTTISMGLDFGYFFYNSGKNLQVGVIFSAGQYSWKKQDLSCEYNNGIIDEKEEQGVSYQGIYNSGPAIAIGTYYPVSRNIAIILESGFMFPIKYDDKGLQYDDKINEIVEEDEHVKVSYLFYAVFGVDIKLSKRLDWLLGIGVIRALSDGETSKRESELDIFRLTASTGIEYRYSRYSIFSFSFISRNTTQKATSDEPGNIFLESDTTVHTLTGIVAFTRLF